MRGLSALYCLACEREGCLANSQFVEICRDLDTSEECPIKFNFNGNYLGDAGSAAIIRTISIMRWVRIINLRDCGAGIKCIKALAEIVIEHPNLRCVDLRGKRNEIFAISGRILLKVLENFSKLVVYVNYDDFPPTLGKKLQAINHHNRIEQKEEENNIKEEKLSIIPEIDSFNLKNKQQDLFYIPTQNIDGTPIYNDNNNNSVLLHLVENFNTYIEDYLYAYHYVGRAAVQLAVDLGPSILPCIHATAVAIPPSVATETGKIYPNNVKTSIRAVDALLGGLRANPFLLEELISARGSILSMYITKLMEIRGEYESLVASRLGENPSFHEIQLETEMRPLYNRIVAGIVQKSMKDLPSMSYVEEHLQEVRNEVLNRLLEGRQRVLPVLLAQIRYFAFNKSTEAKEWANNYINTKKNIPNQEVKKEKEEKEKEKSEESIYNSDNDDDNNASNSRISEKLPKNVNLCVIAMNELHEILNDPYTSARYTVTKPLWESIPMEIRMFLCDLVLRRSVSLYTPLIFTNTGEKDNNENEEKESLKKGNIQLGGDLNDPFDIVQIFERVHSRKDLSEVLCAFEEWYRLRQVECYDVTHVSRQELLSRMSQM